MSWQENQETKRCEPILGLKVWKRMTKVGLSSNFVVNLGRSYFGRNFNFDRRLKMLRRVWKHYINLLENNKSFKSPKVEIY